MRVVRGSLPQVVSLREACDVREGARAGPVGAASGGAFGLAEWVGRMGGRWEAPGGEDRPAMNSPGYGTTPHEWG